MGSLAYQLGEPVTCRFKGAEGQFCQTQTHSLNHTSQPPCALLVSCGSQDLSKDSLEDTCQPTRICLSTGRTPHTSPYLSVQLFNQGDVSKIGVNGKDTSSTGVKADVVGDRTSLWVCPVQGVYMSAWKETQRGDPESGTQFLLEMAATQNRGCSCAHSECALRCRRLGPDLGPAASPLCLHSSQLRETPGPGAHTLPSLGSVAPHSWAEPGNDFCSGNPESGLPGGGGAERGAPPRPEEALWRQHDPWPRLGPGVSKQVAL